MVKKKEASIALLNYSALIGNKEREHERRKERQREKMREKIEIFKSQSSEVKQAIGDYY